MIFSRVVQELNLCSLSTCEITYQRCQNPYTNSNKAHIRPFLHKTEQKLQLKKKPIGGLVKESLSVRPHIRSRWWNLLVLDLAGMELIFITAARMVLWCGFGSKTVLITH